MGAVLQQTNTLVARILLKIKYIFWENIVPEYLFPFYANALIRYKDSKAPTPESVQKIVVWNVDSIGDTLWLSPFFKNVRRIFPNAKITFVCNKQLKEVIIKQCWAEEVLAVEARLYYSGRGFLHNPFESNHMKPDLFFVLEMGSRPADIGRYFAWKIKSDYVVSSYLGICKHLCHRLLPQNGKQVKMWWPKYFLSALEDWDTNLEKNPKIELKYELTEIDKAKEVANQLGIDFTKKTLLIHPFVAPYAQLTKQWPFEYFVKLAKLIDREAQIILSGAMEDFSLCAQLAQEIEKNCNNNIFVIAGRLSILELAAFLKKTTAVLVCDTSVLHIAASQNVPTVTLFGATNMNLIAPTNKNCISLNKKLFCSPCHTYQDHYPSWPKCQFDSPRCMEAITPSLVAEKLNNLLKDDYLKDDRKAKITP